MVTRPTLGGGGMHPLRNRSAEIPLPILPLNSRCTMSKNPASRMATSRTYNYTTDDWLNIQNTRSPRIQVSLTRVLEIAVSGIVNTSRSRTTKLAS